MNIISVVGARPQFIKAAPVSRALRQEHKEILVHTGQHYDSQMSQIFFHEMGIPQPDINLGVGSGQPGWQIGEMLIRLEEIIQSNKPDWVLVYGDTNSTLAGALSARISQIPLAHIEAGLRSFNRQMPEERNRVLTDHCSDLLFCPTQNAVKLLASEGIRQGVHLIGDTMYDAVRQFSEIARHRSTILDDLNLRSKEFVLATIHRPYNTDVATNLQNIFSALREMDDTVVFPVHPRTRQRMAALDGIVQFSSSRHVKVLEPVGYLDMLVLEQNARLILTDSGGVQKEAFFFAVPCVTIRSETEWVETIEAGWNILVRPIAAEICRAVEQFAPIGQPPLLYGDGRAALRCVRILESSTEEVQVR